MRIHDLIDPIWKSRTIKRGTLYAALSSRLGYEYHTAEIKSLEEARRVYRLALEYIREHAARPKQENGK